MNDYYVTAIWIGMALLASLISIRIAIPAALVEILVGSVAGNVPGIREHIDQTAFVIFLAGAGSIILTFLAGAEIDPVSVRKHWRPASPSAPPPSHCPSPERSRSAIGR